MPSLKYTRPPGPFPLPKKINSFRFSDKERHSLVQLLPKPLDEITPHKELIPAGKELKTVAELIVAHAEEVITWYRTIKRANHKNKLTPARDRAAISRLLNALKPFREGSLSEQTCALIPPQLCGSLEQRSKELEGKKNSPDRELIADVCGRIGAILKIPPLLHSVELPRPIALNFVDSVLTFADIKHPDRNEHPDRLARLIFVASPE